MRVYAIRRTDTGEYYPWPYSRNKLPRIFRRRGDAIKSGRYQLSIPTPYEIVEFKLVEVINES